ncbi:MAG: hypothetical protein ACRDOO_16835 [Actinomadura sp.]
MTRTQATGYDGLSSRFVPETELRAFLLACFGIGERELFVGPGYRVADLLRDVPAETVFAAFCTYHPAAGHFAMNFDIGITGLLAERVGRGEFAERFAAHFDAYVLYGDVEPPGLWTVVLADGRRLRAAMDEGPGRYVLDAVTAPVPGLPGVTVNEDLWRHV